VAVITALHILIEVSGSWRPEIGIHHIPVALYLLPIAIAAFRYGFEGGLLTGVWCMALVAPNLALWHRGALDWLGEITYASVVLGTGVAMAWPVERERKQRQRAEATSGRLALLNEALAALSQPVDLGSSLDTVLARLMTTLRLESACIVMWEDSEEEPTVLACRTTAAEDLDMLRQLARVEGLSASDDGNLTVRGRAIAVPLIVEGRSSGALRVLVPEARPPTAEDIGLLKAITSQLGVAIDNARLHEREKRQLRSYAQLVTRAQEDERKRIARELHDDAAMSLVVLCRGLDSLGDSDEGFSSEHRLALGELRSVATATLADIRRFSRDLRPAVLDNLGLVAALEWLRSDLIERTGLKVDLQVEGNRRRLNSETEVAVFRIVQQALRNVERHAGASELVVEVTFKSDQLALSITDNGCGFVLPATSDELIRRGKLGLLGMRERAQLVGGTLSIQSQPGEGTHIAVEVPA
jgi:signal transduction histidine kinase